jgi:signal transduction histidine kinase
MMAATRRLQHRLMLAFGAFALGVAVVFAGHAALFMYALEDHFFELQLQEEAVLQARHFDATGAWAEPLRGHVRRHDDPSTFPDDLRASMLQHPLRREFAGSDGRHYHLHQVLLPGGASSWLVAEVSEHLVLRPMRGTFLHVLAWLAVVMVGTAVVVGTLIARRTTAPLGRLAALVATMQPEDLPEALPQTFADDEVGVLARGLEGLVQRVREFIAREQEFTRDASHELRTPLAVIRSASEQLAATAGMDARSRAHIEHIRQSAAQLEQTVGTLLDLAREDQATERHEDVRLLPLLERIVVEQAPLLGDRSIELELDVPASTRVALRQPILHILLSNLVGNAFAHADAGTVRIGLQGDELQVSNRARETEAHLVHQPSARREGSAGFGLGLGIVRRLCDRHGIVLAFDTVDGLVTARLVLPGVAAGADDNARGSEYRRI